jgi:hypothetical protein
MHVLTEPRPGLGVLVPKLLLGNGSCGPSCAWAH